MPTKEVSSSGLNPILALGAILDGCFLCNSIDDFVSVPASSRDQYKFVRANTSKRDISKKNEKSVTFNDSNNEVILYQSIASKDSIDSIGVEEILEIEDLDEALREILEELSADESDNSSSLMEDERNPPAQSGHHEDESRETAQESAEAEERRASGEDIVDSRVTELDEIAAKWAEKHNNENSANETKSEIVSENDQEEQKKNQSFVSANARTLKQWVLAKKTKDPDTDSETNSSVSGADPSEDPESRKMRKILKKEKSRRKKVKRFFGKLASLKTKEPKQFMKLPKAFCKEALKVLLATGALGREKSYAFGDTPSALNNMSVQKRSTTSEENIEME